MKTVRNKFATSQLISGQISRTSPIRTGTVGISTLNTPSGRQAAILLGPKPLTDARRFITHT